MKSVLIQKKNLTANNKSCLREKTFEKQKKIL